MQNTCPFDVEVVQLKAAIHCATVLEQLPPPWRLDRGESTRGALKYRRGPGEIVIVNHDGRGWWDPTHPHAKGDVFSLVQHLEPQLSFGATRCLLRRLVGMAPAFPEQLRSRSRRPAVSVAELWSRRRPLGRSSHTERYLGLVRRLPQRVLDIASRHGKIREGPEGSAWFPHQDHAGRLTGIEMRGPRWRGFSTDGDKSLFRLPGGDGPACRLAVVEGAIDALSLACLEGPRSDTLYLSTAGGMGPDTIAALEALLAERSTMPAARLVAATDADLAGDRYAGSLRELAMPVGIPAERLRPPRGLKDWNEILTRAGEARGGEALRSRLVEPGGHGAARPGRDVAAGASIDRDQSPVP
jgi:hypothetical protein